MAEIISSVTVLWLNAKATRWVDDTKARRRRNSIRKPRQSLPRFPYRYMIKLFLL